MANFSTNLENIEQFANLIQAPVYWVDQHGVLLGANEIALHIFGYDSLSEIVGKKVNTLFSDEMAKPSCQIYEQILKTGKVHKHKEFITNRKTGQIHCLKSVKSPLHDKNNNLVGFINVSLELTAEESYIPTRKSGVLKYLEILAETLPINLYWEDLNSVVLGGNESLLKAIGAQSIKEIIGKTPYEFYPYEAADRIVQHNNEVMRTEKVLSQEEMITDISTGAVKYFIAIKAPLRDDDGNIIGLVGTSIETTAEKEAELLRRENERQQIALQEKENFAMLACKVAHDISSPLSALETMLDKCDELPENKRSLLRRATEGILDIANNLISNYNKTENSPTSGIEPRQPLLVSDQLMQLLSEKRVQYQQHRVTFETAIAPDAQFAFIRMQKTEFRRSISNLINNAVDALENKDGGVITVQLTADADTVVVKVQDNGKGMSRDRVEKILERQGFTEGKKNGHGLGLQQVWDTLENNQGTMAIQSTPGKGTAIHLNFPRIAASNWIAQEIHLVPENIIVILDDDESIHTAWNLRFSALLTEHPSLRLHHFTQGQEALDFLGTLNPQEKERVLFLSDYELLHQNRNGLQIIEASQIKGAVLVSSYYFNPKIRDTASGLNVKILPKQMASVIPIDMNRDTAIYRAAV